MLKNLKIKYKLFLLVAILTIGFMVFGMIAYRTITNIKISGKMYNDIIQGKDLVADILPPPEYIIEAYLTTFELLNETDKSKIEELIQYETKLKKEYDTRHEVWVQDLKEGELKKVMVEVAYQPVVNFFKILNDEFIPTIKSGDKEKAGQILNSKLSIL